MFTHPEILFDLSRQHQSELIEEAHGAALVRAVLRGRRAARHSRRNAGHHREPGEIHLAGVSHPAGSLMACAVSVAEPAR